MKYALFAALLLTPSLVFAATNNVSLVVEPQGFTPALYPGKALLTSSGSVRLVAVADFHSSSGARLDPGTLTYSWNLNDTILSASSGTGKSTLIIPAPPEYRSETVAVTVSKSGTFLGAGTVTLSPEQPTLRVYRDDPLQGVLFDDALVGTFTLQDAEVSLFGVPYSFPLSVGTPSIHWFLNGSVAESGPSITLRPQGEGAGDASLTSTVDAPSIPETAQANLTIRFGKSSSNFLGL